MSDVPIIHVAMNPRPGERGPADGRVDRKTNAETWSEKLRSRPSSLVIATQGIKNQTVEAKMWAAVDCHFSREWSGIDMCAGGVGVG